MTDYTIKKGDTLTSIAKEHGTTIKELQKDNNIKNVNKIYAGKTLKISDNSVFTAKGENAHKESTPKSNSVFSNNNSSKAQNTPPKGQSNIVKDNETTPKKTPTPNPTPKLKGNNGKDKINTTPKKDTKSTPNNKKTNNPSNNSLKKVEIDEKATQQNKKAAGDITYLKDGSVIISNRVEKRIEQMAERLNTDSTALKGTIFQESRFRLNGKGSAAGLNQMTNDGLAGFNQKYGTNLSKKDIRNMNAIQQLNVAEMSIKHAIEEKGIDNRSKKLSAGQLYAINLYPAGAKRENVITQANVKAYNANKGLDLNGDGKITMSEITKIVNNKAQYVHSENQVT